MADVVIHEPIREFQRELLTELILNLFREDLDQIRQYEVFAQLSPVYNVESFIEQV
ncbi:hypothetical protein [Pseudothermotoga thermarum]|uniref:hypothetical protein n=1 Tax=Pseudothermotoga thermarum TaxID=119394 RepID=UPI000315861E|nr:hypothetical protein [Pseudothermotoga thermarum]